MANNRRSGISFALFWTIIIPCVSGSFGLGLYFGQTKLEKDKIECVAQNSNLLSQIDYLIFKTDSLQKVNSSVSPTIYDVFMNGSFYRGLHLGIDTSHGDRNWVKVQPNGEIKMAYPSGQAWGAVFITIGEAQPPAKRKGKDFSEYTRLIIELKGEADTTIEVGLKDNKDPDNGSESKHTLTLTGQWKEYEINLKNFETADLKNLYVVTEFVFKNIPQTLYVRKIQFK